MSANTPTTKGSSHDKSCHFFPRLPDYELPPQSTLLQNFPYILLVIVRVVFDSISFSISSKTYIIPFPMYMKILIDIGF